MTRSHATNLTDSIFKQPAMRGHDFASSPNAFFARYSFIPALSELRAQGMPGARCARGLVCNGSGRTHTRCQVTPESPGIPHAMVYGLCVPSPVLRYRIHTSDSIFSVGSTKNVSHRSHLTRLWQHLMAQAGSPANPLKKNPVSRCVHSIAGAPGVLATVACATSRRLDTSVGVSGPHDFTVRKKALSS
jgi:hypothetical protein